MNIIPKVLIALIGSIFLLSGMTLTASATGTDSLKTVTDQKTGLEWQVAEPGKKTWKRAKRYCERLRLDGKPDWRLPTIEELESLIEHIKSDPTVVRTTFKEMRSTYYWSSSTRSDRAWLVFFVSGDMKYLYKSSNAHTRCVRGEQ